MIDLDAAWRDHDALVAALDDLKTEIEDYLAGPPDFPAMQRLLGLVLAAEGRLQGFVPDELPASPHPPDPPDDENTRLRECLEGMAWQFAHEFERDGQHYLGTMGLSNREWAFEVLGWDDPHPIPAPVPAGPSQ